MKIGALIVTTGLERVSGVAALLPQVGATCTGQRMISAFRCVNAAMTALVVGPEDKKQERQLSQSGVVFLRCREEASFPEGIREGLRFFAGKYDRVFLVPGDMPLFLPETLKQLLRSSAHIAVPVCSHVSGWPVLLDGPAMEQILAREEGPVLADGTCLWPMEPEPVRVEDTGILLRSGDMSRRQEGISRQNRQLTRPALEVSLCSAEPLYDARLSMLLHLVEDTGSVRDACSLMQVSYSTAWNMLNQAEQSLGYPLVVRLRGGSVGSGSVLTEKGRRLMTAYDRFARDLEKTAGLLYGRFFGDLSL